MTLSKLELSTPSAAERIERRRNAVVYQIYPRSFADSNGDGIGDLRGIASRLDHLAALGVDAIWLSPIFESPQADYGYDVSDFRAIDPDFGSLDDVDGLIAAAHRRGIEVLLDMVPCHTSIEHAWFTEHPDWYIRHPGRERPNNWRSIFGGPAWSRSTGRGDWYLHQFYPEQPSLNWRNPEVVAAIHEVIRFWVDRGVDGFRLDAIPFLFVDPALRDEPPFVGTRMFRSDSEYAELDHIYTAGLPEVELALADLRRAFPAVFFVGEATVPHVDLPPYLASTDLCFSFELLIAPRSAAPIKELIASGAGLRGIAWVLSNHDEPRLVTRWGRADGARLAAMLLLTLPGAAFIYQGDEIGMVDGPGGNPPLDRRGRDAYRHPMQWTRDGGFTTGTPWLPMVDPAQCNVQDQDGDPKSMLTLYRRLIALRREMIGAFTLLDAPDHVVAYRRGAHEVWLNIGEDPVGLPKGEMLLATAPAGTGMLPARSGVVVRV